MVLVILALRPSDRLDWLFPCCCPLVEESLLDEEVGGGAAATGGGGPGGVLLEEVEFGTLFPYIVLGG